MINLEEQEIVKNLISQFFQLMTLEVEIKETAVFDETFRVSLQSDSPQLLIGSQGTTLSAIEHLLRQILRRKIAASFYLDLDINNYKKNKIVYLEQLARETADQVSLTRETKELPLMSAFERRIIHLALAQRADVTTQSRGEEPERRVVIRPRP